MNKQDIYTLCTLIPSMDDYSGHNMYLCGKRDGFNECVKRQFKKCNKRSRGLTPCFFYLSSYLIYKCLHFSNQFLAPM